MGAYVVRRIAGMIPTLVIVAMISFLLIHLVPGDPAIAMLGGDATPEQLSALRRDMGLDQPLFYQFVAWFSRVLRGNLGQSYYLGRPVAQAIAERLPATFSLAVLALAFAVAIGVPSGIAAAVNHNSMLDQLVMGVALLGVSLPGFWVGLSLILMFSVKLGLLPTGGYVPFSENPVDCLVHMIMPAVSLGFLQAGLIARMARSSMLEVIGQDYVRTAKAKGLMPRSVVMKHALRNAAVPIVTVVGNSFSVLLGGAAVVETVFTYPGLGRLVVLAVQRRDYPLVQGAILFLAATCVLVNLLVDLCYCFIDPRIRFK